MRVSSTQESGTIVNEDKDAIILLEDDTNIKEITDEEITKVSTNRVLPKKRKYPWYIDEYETLEKAKAALRRLINNYINIYLGDLFSLLGISLT
jgi:hypothetical protein